MSKLVGIAGVKKGELNCQIVSNRTEALQILRRNLAVTAAGDSGSISVWIGDKGEYRASFSQWQITKEESTFRTKEELREWLMRWWPAMGDQKQLAKLSEVA